MKNFEEIDWALLSLLSFVVIVIGYFTYSEQQQRVLFQQTHNKNLECRQALKNNTKSFINEICGEIPKIGDFVN